MDEDRWELGLVFPRFSPPLWDPDLLLFFREGPLRPLRWWPEQFLTRLYYEPGVRMLPLVRVSPEPPPTTPHMFRMSRNGKSFRSVCYTFAPDGTLVRGRGWDDTATEVLRQVVIWMLKYIVWRRFGFFPGADMGHDPEELLATVDSKAPCPYHTDRAYGDCCRDQHLREAERRARTRPQRDGFTFGIRDSCAVA